MRFRAEFEHELNKPVYGATLFARYIDTNRLYSDGGGVVSGAQYGNNHSHMIRTHKITSHPPDWISRLIMVVHGWLAIDQPVGAAYPSLPSSPSSSSSPNGNGNGGIGASQLAEIILRLSADVKTVTDNVGAIQSTLRRRAPLVQPASASAASASATLPQQPSMSYREAQYQ